MFNNIYSTKGTQVNVQREGWMFRYNRNPWNGKQLRMGSPILPQPKSESNRVHFSSVYRNLNKQLKREQHPMPKINVMLLKLEGFQYATYLDLKIKYYHIGLSKNTSNVCTIILPWWKYFYKRLPVGISNYPKMFQQKTNDSFHEFKFIHAYMDGILVLTKGYWIDYVQNNLREKGLKCNSDKRFFGQTKIECLGFWVTCNGVKPMDKKVQQINNMK